MINVEIGLGLADGGSVSRRGTVGIVLVVVLLLATAGPGQSGQPSELGAQYRSPLGVAIAPDGRTIFVAEHSSNTVAVVDGDTGAVTRRISVPASPSDVLATEGTLWVGGAHGLTALDPSGRSSERPMTTTTNQVRISDLGVAPDGNVAAVDTWNNAVLLLDRGGELLRRWEVDAGPQQAAFTPDGKKLLVTCDGPALLHRTVCVIDTSGARVERYEVSGSASLRGVAVSPDGRFALVAHVRPRAGLPATQVAQGWVFTNTLCYLPLTDPGAGSDAARPVPLPLDEPGRFYATPFDVVIAPDGTKAYVSHAGADVVSVIDLAALESAARKLAQAGPEQLGRGEDLGLTREYVKKRIPVGANPRRMALSNDGGRLVVANHLDDSVTVIDARSDTVEKTIALGDGNAQRLSRARRGEVLFNSGRLAFQGQFACASCHPDGGTDGLNWDLPADGIGNFHNSKSLVGIAGTEPYGWLGNSEDFPARFGTTLKTLFQHQPSDEQLSAIAAYLAQLDHELPPRVDAASDAARRGRELFQSAGCAVCHRGDRYTDGRLHNVGTAVAGDRTELFDTPSLVGVSETAPYLHHGRAQTLEEVLTRFNPEGLHGVAADLSEEERNDLIAFLRSLGTTGADDDGNKESAVSARTGGTIEGTLTYRGAVPRNPVPDTAGNRDPLLTVNSKNGGMRYVVVYLDPPPEAGAKAEGTSDEPTTDEDEPAVIDQRDYRFVPHLIAVRKGELVRFTNSDGGNHNVRGAALDARNQFNVFTGPGGASQQRFYAERPTRPVRLSCDIHAWMGAWVYVFDHPYYAVTDADGRFRIEGVPPGRYVVRAVQPDVGISTQQEVTVEAAGTVRVDREFTPADTKSR